MGVSESRGVRFAALVGVRDAGRVLRDFAAYLPTQAIPAIAGLLVLPILARKLEPTDLGVLAIMQTLITLGYTTAGSWLAAAVVRELPAHRARGDLGTFRVTLVRGVRVMGLAIGGFALLLAAGASFSSAIAANLLLVVAAVLGESLQNVAVSIFAARLRPRAYAVIEIAGRVTGIGLGVALVFEGHGVRGYLIGLAASSLVIGSTGLWLAWPRARGAPAARPSLSPWLRYGVPATGGAILLWGLAFVDRYILALVMDTAAVGVYTMGSVLGNRLVMIPMLAFAIAATPILVTAFEQSGRAEVERLMTSYTRLILLISLPCVAYVAAAGEDLVTLIAGFNYFRYLEAATVAPIVAVGAVLFALAGLATTGLAVSKQTRFLVLSSGIGLIVNVAANVILIPPFGIHGAAIATPIGMAVHLGSSYWWARRYATWRIPWGTLVRTAAAAAAGYAAVTLLPLGGQPLERASLAAGVGLATYVLTLVALGERRRFAARGWGAAAAAPVGEPEP